MTVTVTEKGRTTSTTASTTQTCAFTGSLAAGRTVVVFIDAPTGATNTTLTVTDSKSNTYAMSQVVYHNAYAPAVAVATLTTGVTSSDTITVTLGVSSSEWAIVILDLGVVGSVDVSGKFPSDGSTHPTASVSSSGAATADGQIVLAGFVNSNTTHTFTAGSGFTALPGGVVQADTGSAARQLWVEWREYTTGSGGVRSAGGSYATAANYAAVLVAITSTAGGGGGGGSGATSYAHIGGTWVATQRLTWSGSAWI